MLRHKSFGLLLGFAFLSLLHPSLTEKPLQIELGKDQNEVAEMTKPNDTVGAKAKQGGESVAVEDNHKENGTDSETGEKIGEKNTDEKKTKASSKSEEEKKGDEQPLAEGEEKKSFDDVVAEDEVAISQYFERIRARLAKEKEEEEKATAAHAKAQHHHHQQQKPKEEAEEQNPIQAVSNELAKIQMNCPSLFSRAFAKVTNMVKADEQKEKKDLEWTQNCRVLEQMKQAWVDWLDFLKEKQVAKNKPAGSVGGKQKELDENDTGLFDKMTVRPLLQQIHLPPPANHDKPPQGPEQLEGEQIELAEILDYYDKVAQKERPEIGSNPLVWGNEAPYKFVKMLKIELSQAEEHKNIKAEEEDEVSLEEILNEEKDVLSGQSLDFHVVKHKAKYQKHIEEHEEAVWKKMGDVWNYGKKVLKNVKNMAVHVKNVVLGGEKEKEGKEEAKNAHGGKEKDMKHQERGDEHAGKQEQGEKEKGKDAEQAENGTREDEKKEGGNVSKQKQNHVGHATAN